MISFNSFMIIMKLVALFSCGMLTGSYLESEEYKRAALWFVCGILWIILFFRELHS